MILLIDNYDSFVHNLARYVKQLGFKCDVLRNDKISIEEIAALNPEAIIISPGPCEPKDAGICIGLIQKLGGSTPILGVCLGHQAIGDAYGGKTVAAQNPTHGKASIIKHNGADLFEGLASPMSVGRYHSLISDISKSERLKATARTKSGEIMAIQHKTNPVFGVQFHPESVLTPDGMEIIKNFLAQAKDWNLQQNNI